jgi:hypothetical protein
VNEINQLEENAEEVGPQDSKIDEKEMKMISFTTTTDSDGNHGNRQSEHVYTIENSSLLNGNFFSHTLHEYGFSPVCERKCLM